MPNGQHATKLSLNTPTGVSRAGDISLSALLKMLPEQELYQGHVFTVGLQLDVIFFLECTFCCINAVFTVFKCLKCHKTPSQYQ